MIQLTVCECVSAVCEPLKERREVVPGVQTRDMRSWRDTEDERPALDSSSHHWIQLMPDDCLCFLHPEEARWCLCVCVCERSYEVV